MLIFHCSPAQSYYNPENKNIKIIVHKCQYYALADNNILRFLQGL